MKNIVGQMQEWQKKVEYSLHFTLTECQCEHTSRMQSFARELIQAKELVMQALQNCAGKRQCINNE